MPKVSRDDGFLADLDWRWSVVENIRESLSRAAQSRYARRPAKRPTRTAEGYGSLVR
jgi:hypothetical protein